ncbi:hypothetical protein DY000_02010588 [Brassica cretica]|uniref:Uncharacterized protein n=1 Tax=Brassica cretica TaxID=69181 RepID=A0ABQ7BUP6_BRACR|nr:hypothetical protein DY000_02010588 [Brassica cretica]
MAQGSYHVGLLGGLAQDGKLCPELTYFEVYDRWNELHHQKSFLCKDQHVEIEQSCYFGSARALVRKLEKNRIRDLSSTFWNLEPTKEPVVRTGGNILHFSLLPIVLVSGRPRPHHLSSQELDKVNSSTVIWPPVCSYHNDNRYARNSLGVGYIGLVATYCYLTTTKPTYHDLGVDIDYESLVPLRVPIMCSWMRLLNFFKLSASLLFSVCETK